MKQYERVVEVMRRRSGTVTAVATVVLLGGLVIVLAGRWGQFGTAIATAPWWTLAIAAVLHIGSLVARSEAWNVCVRAAGGTVGRRQIYRAASFGYVGNLVNGQFGFAMRIAALRRSAPRETPKALALATTEVPILIIEATLAALTSFTRIGPLGWPGWAPVAACVGMLALMEGLRRLSLRYQRGWGQGLAVLRDAPGRWRIIALVVGAICAQITRNWLLLQASGVNASVLDATAVLIAVAVLSPLPLGPGVGASAAVLILGTNGVAAVAAAGVLLTATGAAGALGYAGWAMADRLWSARSRLALKHASTSSLTPSRLEASK
ncbi:MAG: hypothetical protein QOD66_202 [Solirubrobacteraceae bacterium]|nr:hypothetical protein [Solirubrobacteraceae bacterium]